MLFRHSRFHLDLQNLPLGDVCDCRTVITHLDLGHLEASRPQLGGLHFLPTITFSGSWNSLGNWLESENLHGKSNGLNLRTCKQQALLVCQQRSHTTCPSIGTMPLYCDHQQNLKLDQEIKIGPVAQYASMPCQATTINIILFHCVFQILFCYIILLCTKFEMYLILQGSQAIFLVILCGFCELKGWSLLFFFPTPMTQCTCEMFAELAPARSSKFCV